MRTTVFEYKGVVGIKSDVHAEGLLNSPLNKGQLGFVVDAKYVDIQPLALEILRKIRKSGDDIGDVDVYKTENDQIIFSWLGGPLKVLIHEEVSGSNSYDPSLLTACDTVETPEDFKKFVENM